jgi:FKBP-type peptidyl-prolyl cis-trans isomerase 2
MMYRTKTIRKFSRVALLVLAFGALSVPVQAQDGIQEGKQVALEYTLKLNDGTVVDTNVGKPPLNYTQGEGSLLPAFEREMSGMKAEESKQFTLSATEGYGEVNPGAFKEVEISAIPEDSRQVGATLIAQSRQGERRPVKVAEVRESTVVLDLNHPLAGQSLHFDVRVISVQ